MRFLIAVATAVAIASPALADFLILPDGHMPGDPLKNYEQMPPPPADGQIYGLSDGAWTVVPPEDISNEVGAISYDPSGDFFTYTPFPGATETVVPLVAPTPIQFCNPANGASINLASNTTAAYNSREADNAAQGTPGPFLNAAALADFTATNAPDDDRVEIFRTEGLLLENPNQCRAARAICHFRGATPKMRLGKSRFILYMEGMGASRLALEFDNWHGVDPTAAVDGEWEGGEPIYDVGVYSIPAGGTLQLPDIVFSLARQRGVPNVTDQFLATQSVATFCHINVR